MTTFEHFNKFSIANSIVVGFLLCLCFSCASYPRFADNPSYKPEKSLDNNLSLLEGFYENAYSTDGRISSHLWEELFPTAFLFTSKKRRAYAYCTDCLVKIKATDGNTLVFSLYKQDTLLDSKKMIGYLDPNYFYCQRKMVQGVPFILFHSSYTRYRLSLGPEAALRIDYTSNGYGMIFLFGAGGASSGSNSYKKIRD